MFGKHFIIGCEPAPHNSFKLEIRCPFCNKISSLVIGDQNRFAQWQAGTLHVQEAFPNASKDDRELLINGVCKKCWDEM